MGMSMHVVGFRPPDDRWKAMREIYNSCVAQNVSIPDEVHTFFDDEPPGDKPGLEIELGDAAKKYRGDCREGWEIDLRKVPQGVNVIRVYAAY